MTAPRNILLVLLWLWASSSAVAVAKLATVGLMPIDGDQPAWVEVAIVDLTHRLSEAEMAVVERTAIDAVLAEHELSLQDLVRKPLDQGRLLGCEYLVLLRAQGDTATARRLEALALEVVSGNVIAEGTWSVDRDDEQFIKISRELSQAIKQGISRNRAQADRPTATVLHVTDRGPHDRTRYLEATLRDIVESQLERRGYRVLRRRHSGHLMAETTLGASGLVRPDAAVLAEAADHVVSVEYREKPAENLTFNQTPIELKMSVQADGQPATTRTLQFTLAELGKLPTMLHEALPEVNDHVTPAADGPQDAQDTQGLQRWIEAAQLMAEVNTTLQDLTLADDHARRIRLCERIIFLDPTLAEAHYYYSGDLPLNR